MKTVMISIQPKWCELISSGKKTIEVRKTEPKLEVPFKCYIYETKAKVSGEIDFYKDDCLEIKMRNEQIIGEFICDKIDIIPPCTAHNGLHYPLYTYPELEILVKNACLTDMELFMYGVKTKNGCYGASSKVVKLYAWHITDLVIYDKPKELCEFYSAEVCKDYWGGNSGCDDVCGIAENNQCRGGHTALRNPPQSWGYVEEIK